MSVPSIARHLTGSSLSRFSCLVPYSTHVLVAVAASSMGLGSAGIAVWCPGCLAWRRWLDGVFFLPKDAGRDSKIQPFCALWSPSVVVQNFRYPTMALNFLVNRLQSIYKEVERYCWILQILYRHGKKHSFPGLSKQDEHTQSSHRHHARQPGRYFVMLAEPRHAATRCLAQSCDGSSLPHLRGGLSMQNNFMVNDNTCVVSKARSRTPNAGHPIPQSQAWLGVLQLCGRRHQGSLEDGMRATSPENPHLRIRVLA